MAKQNKKQQNILTISTISKSSQLKLQNANKRHKTVLESSSPFDESLPEDYRFRGILTSSNIPKVNTQATSTLSPYILELRPQTQNSFDDAYSSEPIRLNFLTSSSVFSDDSVVSLGTSHDLELTPEELRGQLVQPMPTRTSSFSLPAFPSFFSKSHLASVLQNIPLQIHRHPESISIETFEPTPIPENILSYFDFPETEETESEESEPLVELSNMVFVEQEEIAEDFEPRESVFTRFFASVQSSLLLPNGWQRAIGAFVLVSFAFVLPLHAMNVLSKLRETKSSAQTDGTQALDQLKNAANIGLVQDPTRAEGNFENASLKFAHARESIDGLGAGVKLLLSSLSQTKTAYTSNRALLQIGEELSLAGVQISDGLSALKEQMNPTPASRLALLQLYLSAAQPHLRAATDALKDVSDSELTGANKDTFSTLATTLPALTDSTQQFLDLYPAVSGMLGTDGSKHYLLIFQNNTEMRATGGFMGSYAEVTVHDGLIESFNVPGGGTYDLQGWLKENLVSPWPLQLVSARWEFQDANWFPDFPTTARQILQFYQNAGGSDVDGVIAVNASFIQTLIGQLGPIDVPEYGRIIDQQNFLSETQKIVETEYDKVENKPKEFIGTLAPKLLEKTKHLEPEQFLSFAEALNHGLAQKDVQLYFTDEDLQKTVLQEGWGGNIKPTDKDYLMVVNTNIGGGKTDGVIQDTVDVDVTIEPTGEIVNKVKIERTHTGTPGDEFTGVNNVNFLRLYVPKGSTLLKASGFNIPRSTLFETPDPDWIVDKNLQYANDSYLIDPVSKTQSYEEDGKMVFGNWTQTKPGTTSTVTFEYQLPFTFKELLAKPGWIERASAVFGKTKTDSYTLMVQKQSGVEQRKTTVRIHVPDTLKSVWSSGNLSHTELQNVTDHFLGALFENAL